MRHLAFEMYAGEFAAIRAACIEDRLADLRMGKVTPYLTLFPEPFTASDISLFEIAVAAISGSSKPLEIERDEPVGCLFIDKFNPDWIASIAELGPAKAHVLQHELSLAYEAQELEKPEWATKDFSELMAQFITLCETAQRAGLDLVMVWIL